MRKPENQEVQSFLNDIMLIDLEKYESLVEAREIIFHLFPKTEEKIMYGGIVFFHNKEMYSGLFVRQQYVTLEFSKGFLMEDPNSHLEGKGKYRRHIKIRTKADIKNKNVMFFIRQAL